MLGHQLLCQEYVVTVLIRKGLVYLLKSMGVLLLNSAGTDSVSKS